MRSPKTRKKTAFVPRIIFRAATVAGVIPLCAVACGGSLASGVACVGFDGGPCGPGDSALLPGVAADAFYGVGVAAFDSGDAHMTFGNVAEMAFEGGGVAYMSFDSGDARGVADAGPGDATFGVAADAFAKDTGNSG